MKTKIIYFDAKIWREFIRKLLYPAILGSLIYEFTNPQISEKYFYLFVTLILYILDNLYLNALILHEIKKNKTKKRIMDKGWKIALDGAVAILFMVIIYLIQKKLYTWISFTSIFIFISAYYYYPNTKRSRLILAILIVISILITISLFLLLYCCNCSSSIIVKSAYALIVLAYFITILFDYYPNKNK